MLEEIKLKSIKSIRGRRFFKKKCPLINENDKNTILITNGKGGLTKEFLTDMKLLKSPLVMSYELKQKISIFEDNTLLNNLFTKFNSSLFIMGSHSKKRPNNMIFGRTFDHQILDMYEFEISDYASLKSNSLDKFNLGSKPILIFSGFPNDSENMPKFYLKTLFTDMFRGPKVKNINRCGLDYCIHFESVTDERILMTVSKVNTSIENERRIINEVVEIGASCTLTLRRQQIPDSDVWKKSLKKPIAAKAKKQKNVEKDVFGNVYGRVHLGRQDNDKLSKLVSDKYHRKMRKSNRQVEEMEVE